MRICNYAIYSPMFIMPLTLPYYGEGIVHNLIYYYISLKLHYTFILIDSYYINSIAKLRATVYSVRANHYIVL